MERRVGLEALGVVKVSDQKRKTRCLWSWGIRGTLEPCAFWGERRAFKCRGSSPGHGLRVGRASTRGNGFQTRGFSHLEVSFRP